MLLTVAIGVIGLGVMILVHETGHFIAARTAGHETWDEVCWYRRADDGQNLKWLPYIQGSACSIKQGGGDGPVEVERVYRGVPGPLYGCGVLAKQCDSGQKS